MTQQKAISLVVNGQEIPIGPTALADVELHFDLGSQRFALSCHAVENLAPAPSIVLECPFDAQSSLDANRIRALRGAHGKTIRVRVVSDLVPMEADVFPMVPLEWGHNARAGPARFYFSRDQTAERESPALGEASFTITNMSVLNSVGHFVTGSERMESLGGAVLRDHDWIVQVRQSPHRQHSQAYLHAIGGYRVTHIASVCRNDGSSFSPDEVLQYINKVRLFLSFCNGAWVGTRDLTGADERWQTVWKYWQGYPASWSDGRRPESWLKKYGQLNVDESTAIATLFPLFSKAIEQDKTIGQCIERYLGANETQPFMNFTSNRTMGEMAVAALNPKPGVNNPWPQVEKDLRCAGLSLAIPAECPHLIRLYEANPEWAKKHHDQTRWRSGLTALRELRNCYEHPGNSVNGLNEQYSGQALFEAWNLGQWYLETVILHKCGYTGPRSNRTKGGEWGPLQ